MLHLSVKNISSLWFSVHTPLRHFKLKVNPELWAACQKVDLRFKSPSGAAQPNQYRKADKMAFAEAVLNELNQDSLRTERDAYGVA